ncbi:hypothetical protein HANVADRAFT_48337 [Hanseniaspora valbyensis NRRL Y-1626]|uniref:DH domain-containing protein n=1 Tax=Hanseniaspora valbyensis NRRL Y-1626 TaxID=766949 RepID=A0A1B7TF40_9ASCO|nr:hypothetical protein HANVADRAFT_48337 [Hanseniaspora valbyensis NRRL Y-1626]
MTPIIEKENYLTNPYSKTLWKDQEENKMTVNKFKTDGKANIQRRLTERRQKENLTLPLSELKKDGVFKIKCLNSNNSNKKTFIPQLLLNSFSEDEQDLTPNTSTPSIANTDFLCTFNNQKEKIWTTAQFKKINSPLDLFDLKTPLKSGNEYSRKNRDFINILETFYNYELDYVNNLELIIDVFQTQFQRNVKIKSKLATIKSNNDGEILIFGNIETMIELSHVFLDNFLKYLSEFFNINKNEKEFWQVIKQNLIFTDFKQFKIINILKQEFIKWRQSYKSYIITHEKQIEYLNFLITNPETKQWLIKWLAKCEDSLPINCIKDGSISSTFFNLLDKPNERVVNWITFIDSLVPLCQSLLSIQSYDEFLHLLNQINDYQKNLKRQQSFFNTTKRISVTDCFPFSKPVEVSNVVDIDTCASSVYSEYPNPLIKKFDLNSKMDNRFISCNKDAFDKLVSLDDSNTIETNNLEKQIKDFEKITTHLSILEDKIENIFLSDYVINLHNYTNKWKQLYNLDNSNNKCCNIYELYQQKLETQLIHISKLQSIELQNINKNIQQCLNYCNIIEKVIMERKNLINAIKTSKSDDITINAISNQITHLTETLSKDLIKFLNLVKKFIINLSLKLNNVNLSFFKIMIGNSKNLDEFITNYERKEIEFGDNFDIIQQYTINKDNTKQVLKDHNTAMNANNNTYHSIIYSKTFRHLFN